MRIIKSHTNDYIKEMKSLKLKKNRDVLGKYIVEGAKIIEEALDLNLPVESLLTTGSKKDSLVMQAKERGVDVISVPYEILEQIADTKSPPKDIACIKKHALPAVTEGRFFLVADDINDPKNLGTIIRTADAVGVDGIWISQNSVDLFGPKVQRAAMGSTFHVKMEVCDIAKKLKWFKSTGGTVVAGHLMGEETLPASFDKVCLVVGNEARGISPNIKELCDVLYKIRIYGQAESLNASVAAGIMMYNIRGLLK